MSLFSSLVFILCLLSLSAHPNSRSSERGRGNDESGAQLEQMEAPTSFPTALYEQGELGKLWWYVVQATIMFDGTVRSNPNEATDYALTFTLKDRLRHKPDTFAEVLEVNILRTPM